MAEWSHQCKGAGRLLLIPRGEQCDRCGRDEIDAYTEHGARVLERLGLPVPPPARGVPPSDGSQR